MGNEWVRFKFKDFAEIKGGKRLPLGTALVQYKTEHPYIRIVDFSNGTISDASMMFVPNEVYPLIKRYIVDEEDLLITIVGNSIGLIALVPKKLQNANLTENAAKLLTNKEIANNRFLLYFLQSSYGQEEIFKNVVGSAQPKLPLYGIGNINIDLPPLPNQKAIAFILGTLDDKIELIRSMNETLEAMARAMFKSWFVDFDPVRKKAEGQPTGLPPEIDALFPDSFENSELGEIPKGWRVLTLSEIIDINPSRTLSKGKLATYLEMKNLPERGMSPNTWEKKEYAGGTKFKNNDTLLARITPCLENGKTCYVQFLEDDEIAFGSTEYIILSGKEPVPSEWCYLLARDDAFRDFAISNMNGSSGRQRVERDSIGRYEVAIPNQGSIFSAFKRTASVGFKAIHSQYLEMQTLIKLRDSLLPKLVSGELELSDQIIKKILEPVK